MQGQPLLTMLSTTVATASQVRREEEVLGWLNSQNLGHTYKGTRYSYCFSLAGNTLEIQEQNSHRVVRKSTVDLAHLREISISDFDADGVNVSSVTLEGGTRSIAHFLDGRRKAEPAVLIWIEHDRNLAGRLARALAHLGQAVCISECHHAGRRPAVLRSSGSPSLVENPPRFFPSDGARVA